MNVIENNAPKFSVRINKFITVDKNFQSICFYGEHFLFGLAQASVIRRLYEEGKTGHPYIHFNMLLSDAGCKSMYLRDLFKSNPNWKKIIHSSGRGFYRLHPVFFNEDCAEQAFQSSKITFDKNLQSICYYGETFVFSARQARIIKMLYRAGRSGQPYISSHILLTRTGCKDGHIRNVFHPNPHWKKIIHRGEKGFYRLDEAFFKKGCVQTSLLKQ